MGKYGSRIGVVGECQMGGDCEGSVGVATGRQCLKLSSLALSEEAKRVRLPSPWMVEVSLQRKPSLCWLHTPTWDWTSGSLSAEVGTLRGYP